MWPRLPPDNAATMTAAGGPRGARPLRGRDIELKTPGELEAMRAAGLVVAKALAAVTAAARPGVSTGELDEMAEQTIRDAGAVPSFLGYHGYPATICASVNEQIVHGIPSRRQVLADGDLMSVDCGAIVDGWHGDAAVTLAVGSGDRDDLALSAACREALDAGIAAISPEARLGDVSHAVQTSIVAPAAATAWVRHRRGVRRARHRHLDAHGSVPAQPRRLRSGPAAARRDGAGRGADADRGRPGDPRAGRRLDRGDRRRRRAAHWEHSVAVTEDGPRMLTLPA